METQASIGSFYESFGTQKDILAKILLLIEEYGKCAKKHMEKKKHK